MNVPGDIRHPSAKKVDKANAADGGGKPDTEASAPAKSGAKAPAKAGGKTPAKAGAAKTAAAKAGSGKGAGGGGRATGAGGGKGPRKPLAPVKVSQGRNWGPIALYGLAGLLALAIVGFGAFQVIKQNQDFRPWQERAAELEGVTDYSKTDPGLLEQGKHKWGPVTYKYNPPSAGEHNPNWQRCQGDVYPAAIASEHALHSMEHGAVWITYRPDLAADQVETLAKKVRGNDYLFMSPYPGLDKPISMQAWGYQLKLDNADDERVDQFIKIFRQNAGPENATCTSGSFIDSTGTVPKDLGKEQSEAQASAAAAQGNP